MTISIDKIVDGFPHPNIAPIVGIPMYEPIAELNLQLNANAAEYTTTKTSLLTVHNDYMTSWNLAMVLI
jgi:hypothetical protein